MVKTDLAILKQLDNETAIQLIDSAYKYLLDKKSVPIKKLAVNARVPFSAIITFLKGNPQHRIAELDQLDMEDEVKKVVKAKVYLMYAQNFTQVGLLGSYNAEMERMTEKK